MVRDTVDYEQFDGVHALQRYAYWSGRLYAALAFPHHRLSTAC